MTASRLRSVVEEQLMAMLARNLDFSPPPEDLPNIIGVWTADFVRLGLTDADAERLRAAFMAFGPKAYKWPQPRVIADHLPRPVSTTNYHRCEWKNGECRCQMSGTRAHGQRNYCAWHDLCLDSPQIATDRAKFNRWHSQLLASLAADPIRKLLREKNLPVRPASDFDRETEACWKLVLGAPIEKSPLSRLGAAMDDKQKRPRQHAFDICMLLTKAQRRAALEQVPPELQSHVKLLVEQWFRLVDPIARRILKEKSVKSRIEQLDKMPDAIRLAVDRRMDELVQEQTECS